MKELLNLTLCWTKAGKAYDRHSPKKTKSDVESAKKLQRPET